MGAPLPLDAADRVAALFRLGILDDPPAPDLDGLTRLAVAVTGSPVAMINLFDATRQWQASVAGSARSIVSREDSMCAHTVAAGRTVHVPDAREDARFRYSPMVIGPLDLVRSYCGVPLRDVKGVAVGTLCVMDLRPRSLTSGQVEALQDLAAQVEHLFEMRRQHAQLVDVLAEVDHLATHDALTGVANRRILVDRAEQAVIRAQRTQIFPTLFLCNLDGFKAVNDTFGRDAGDIVLREVGQRLSTAMRPADTVARLGGDEFVVLCDDVAVGDRRRVAHRIRSAVMEPVDLPGAVAHVGTSVGMVVARSGQTVDSMLKAADRAMYADKAARRVSA